MENVIYNELLISGYKVDVGSVDCSEYIERKQVQKQLEVDFVCNLGSKRIYVQSALSISEQEKAEQEQKSLIFIRDSFKKVIIAKDAPTHYTEKGILILNLFDFLLDFDSLNK